MGNDTSGPFPCQFRQDRDSNTTCQYITCQWHVVSCVQSGPNNIRIILKKNLHAFKSLKFKYHPRQRNLFAKSAMHECPSPFEMPSLPDLPFEGLILVFRTYLHLCIDSCFVAILGSLCLDPRLVWLSCDGLSLIIELLQNQSSRHTSIPQPLMTYRHAHF